MVSPSTISVDLRGGPHGEVSLDAIPLLDGEAPEILEYCGYTYRALPKVPGRHRPLYHFMPAVPAQSSRKISGAKPDKAPARKPQKKNAPEAEFSSR